MSRRAVAVVLLAASLVGLFYLSVYPLQGHREPQGFDTARYLWRNRCVAEGGVRALQACRPPLGTSMPGRVAEPLVVGSASSLVPVPGLSGIAAVPAVLASVLALTGAALAARRGAVRSVVVTTIAVGTSALVARLAGPEGYLDNLLALAFVTAALVLTAQSGRGAAIAAAISLGAAGLAHWPTLALGVAILVGTATLRLPAAVRALRHGEARLRELDVVRILVITAAGIALWAAGATWLVGEGADRFFADPVSSRQKVLADLSRYLLPVMVPVALAGGLFLGQRHDDRRALLEPMLVAWVGVVGVAVALWIVAPAVPLPLPGSGFPLHRLVAMALPVPMLVAVAIDSLGRNIRKRSVLVALTSVALLAWGWIGYRHWAEHEPFMSGERLAEAASASSYLNQHVGDHVPVVFVIDGVAGNAFTDLYQIADNVRTQLRPARIAQTYLYLGQVERLVEREPTLIGDPSYDAASRFRWGVLPRVLDGPHVVLVLRTLSPEFDELSAAMPQRVVGPGVVVLTGPAPRARIEGKAPPSVEGLSVLAAFAGFFALLWVSGAGWARVVADDDVTAMTLAPALGGVGLTWIGLIASAFGIRPAGWGGAAIVAISVTTGAVAAAHLRSDDRAGREST